MIRGLSVNSVSVLSPAIIGLMMDEPMTWALVKARLDKAGRGAQAALARRLKIDPSYFARKLTRGQELTVSQARAIDAFFQEIEEGADFSSLQEEQAPFIPAPRRVPMFGYAAASGGDRIAFNTGDVLDYVELPSGVTPPGEVFIVRTFGSSMEPRIFDGELLVVQRNVPPARGRDAVIEFRDGSGVVKTYEGMRNGRVYAHQYNDDRTLDWDATTVKAMHNVWCRL